jgi:ribosomal protein S27E
VYVGHAAVALALRGREPRLPIVPLVLACYGPDWIEVALMVPHPREGMAPFTHSLPAVVVGALLATALWSLTKRPGARLLGLGWLLHWPADLFTGLKPVLFATPLVGLDLYKIPVLDFLLESVVVAIGCAIYARAFPPRAESRRVIVILGAALVALQGAVDVALGVMRNTDWEPSLALADGRSHLPRSGAHGWPGLRMAFAPRVSDSRHEDAMATHDGPRGIVTLVCLTCGKEKFFTSEVPAAVSCEQCGSTVFRTFATPTEPDEAAIDALEAQARSMAYGDSSPDTTPDDVRDLDAR